jgi:hypothetical protein
MFAEELPEVAPSTSIEMLEKPNTPPDTLKYMRRRKVRGDHISVPFL